jgi:hypothetical protein
MTETSDRRSFLAHTAGVAAGLALPASARAVLDPPATDKKVAAIVSTYYRYAHADNIVTRFMEGYSIVGESYPPPCKVASLYIDQVGDTDIGKPLAKRWNIPVFDSIAGALTLGTSKLAVDGVLIVCEQGDYMIDARGVTHYPRRQFFEQVVKVFRDSGRSVPVFNDKHLSWNWDDAKWMYDQSRELGFPFMAGSSVPVTWRSPNLRPVNVPWEAALSVGYGHFEVYGFHTLEALQVMAECRPGGEVGVKAVQALEGPAAWAAAKEGLWDRGLLNVAAATLPSKPRPKPLEVDDADALVYRVEYRDGLVGAAYLSRKAFADWAFAGRAKGHRQPLACWYKMPKPQRDHFSFLVHNVAQMMTGGKATYPVERTLLTTGTLAALMESKGAGGKRVETPHLGVTYRPAAVG